MTTTAQRDAEALWAQGQKARQARRKWAVESVKDEMTPAEWAHMIRAVRDTRACFEGQQSEFGGQVIDCARSSDYGLAARVSAANRLAMLKRHALIETHDPRAGDQPDKEPGIVEMLMRMSTLPEIAARFGAMRWRTHNGVRQLEPDARKFRAPVLDVITAIAGFYENGAKPRGWRGGTYGPLDRLDLISQNGVIL